LLEEIDQAFSNVQLALQDAGVKEGWGGVFRVNSYHVGFEGEENKEEVLGRLVENLKKYCPGHAPIWTCVGVAALGLPGMRVEIEAVAVDEK
jgi:enamine deaminase RidA (YjgF/YER057c/UK114 family)